MNLRCHVAALLLAGYIAKPTVTFPYDKAEAKVIAKGCVEWAELLLKVLDGKDD